MNAGDELVTTEIIFAGVLSELSPEEAVAVLSALVFQASLLHHFHASMRHQAADAFCSPILLFIPASQCTKALLRPVRQRCPLLCGTIECHFKLRIARANWIYLIAMSIHHCQLLLRTNTRQGQRSQVSKRLGKVNFQEPAGEE